VRTFSARLRRNWAGSKQRNADGQCNDAEVDELKLRAVASTENEAPCAARTSAVYRNWFVLCSLFATQIGLAVRLRLRGRGSLYLTGAVAFCAAMRKGAIAIPAASTIKNKLLKPVWKSAHAESNLSTEPPAACGSTASTT